MAVDPEPLFPPGIIDTDLATIERVCVLERPNNQSRAFLFSRLIIYFQKLALLGVTLRVWVDGSFVTSKETPGDIDIFVWLNDEEMDKLPPDKTTLARDLLHHSNRAVLRARYHIDMYCGSDADIGARMNWRGIYGFVKETEHAKGIPQIVIGKQEDESDNLA